MESLHLVGTAQHVAPFFSEVLQGPPAIVQLLHIMSNSIRNSILPWILHSEYVKLVFSSFTPKMYNGAV